MSGAFHSWTKDPLLDDTLFMHARWVSAGDEAQLAIYLGGAHGFTLLPNDLSKAATAKMNSFPEPGSRLITKPRPWAGSARPSRERIAYEQSSDNQILW
jgi:acetyl esterase/lipase